MAVHRAGAGGSIRTPRRHVSLRAGRIATPGPPATAGRPAIPLLWDRLPVHSADDRLGRTHRVVGGPAGIIRRAAGYFSVLPASTVMGSPVT